MKLQLPKGWGWLVALLLSVCTIPAPAEACSQCSSLAPNIKARIFKAKPATTFGGLSSDLEYNLGRWHLAGMLSLEKVTAIIEAIDTGSWKRNVTLPESWSGDNFWVATSGAVGARKTRGGKYYASDDPRPLVVDIVYTKLGVFMFRDSCSNLMVGIPPLEKPTPPAPTPPKPQPAAPPVPAELEQYQLQQQVAEANAAAYAKAEVNFAPVINIPPAQIYLILPPSTGASTPVLPYTPTYIPPASGETIYPPQLYLSPGGDIDINIPQVRRPPGGGQDYRRNIPHGKKGENQPTFPTHRRRRP